MHGRQRLQQKAKIPFQERDLRPHILQHGYAVLKVVNV
jgi:hypothetical protein